MEASFIFGGLFGIFLLLAFAAQLWASAWPGEDAGPRRQSFRILVAVALPLPDASVATPCCSLEKVDDGAALTVTVIASSSEREGVPLSVTRTVKV